MTRGERLSLYVGLTALTAFSIDGLLPAMPMIETEFAGTLRVSTAGLITFFVFGMAVGELLLGPLSDAAGRRVVVVGGLLVFAIGTILAATADSFGTVVLGRFLQGAGVAGPKIGTRAIIRDRYAGTDMAQVMSIIFTLLILVPMIAPAIGAVIAGAGGWRGVFWAYLALALGLGLWLWLRHPETLPAESRIPLRWRTLAHNSRGMLARRDVTPVVIATGFIFGAQLTYFAVAADLFGQSYGLSAEMPLLFAVLATGTGVALVLNVRFVKRIGMETPILAGLVLLCASGAGLTGAAWMTRGVPPLGLLLALGWVGFFALGLLFGNLNALAMRPLGTVAGLGASLIASISSLVAFLFASVVEGLTQGPVWAVACAFTLAGVLSGLLIFAALPQRRRLP